MIIIVIIILSIMVCNISALLYKYTLEQNSPSRFKDGSIIYLKNICSFT